MIQILMNDVVSLRPPLPPLPFSIPPDTTNPEPHQLRLLSHGDKEARGGEPQLREEEARRWRGVHGAYPLPYRTVRDFLVANLADIERNHQKPAV